MAVKTEQSSTGDQIAFPGYSPNPKLQSKKNGNENNKKRKPNKITTDFAKVEYHNGFARGILTFLKIELKIK